MEIAGTVALVTGAASGIGRSSALALTARGASVVYIADLDVEGLSETAELIAAAGGRAEVHRTDVADMTSQRDLFGRISSEAGRLDIVHNNAGIPSGLPHFPDIALERISALVDVNLKGVLLGTTLAVHAMVAGGAIVNTASITADMIDVREAIYGTTKAAVVHFTRCCGGLYETHGVRVNCVLPGVVETPMLDTAPWVRAAMGAIPLLHPDDIAAQVLELVDDDTKFGQTVTVMNDLGGSRREAGRPVHLRNTRVVHYFWDKEGET